MDIGMGCSRVVTIAAANCLVDREDVDDRLVRSTAAIAKTAVAWNRTKSVVARTMSEPLRVLLLQPQKQHRQPILPQPPLAANARAHAFEL